MNKTTKTKKKDFLKIGRPRFKEILRRYFISCQDRIKETKSGKPLLLEAKIPTIEGLALKLGVSRHQLEMWSNQYEVVGDAYEKIHQIQVERCVNGGLSNLYNPFIAKIILARNGYRENIEIADPDKNKALDKIGNALIELAKNESEK